MLLYFLGASKLTMLYVIINTVTAIAGKALVVAKVALAIATALLLKKASGECVFFLFSFFFFSKRKCEYPVYDFYYSRRWIYDF